MPVIALEGPDGIGKTTLTKLLHSKINNSILTIHPGSTDFGQLIRNTAKTHKYSNPLISQLLMASDYLAFKEEYLTKNNNLIICDRHTPISCYIYGLATGLTTEICDNLIEFMSPPPLEFLFILKCNKEKLVNRHKVRDNDENDKFEKDSIKAKVDELYDQPVFDITPMSKRTKLIDTTNRTPEKITTEILNILVSYEIIRPEHLSHN